MKKVVRFLIALAIGFVVGVIVSGRIACLPTDLNWLRP